jgi:NADPH:quinone reductase
MKIIRVYEYGEPGQLRLEQAPIPEPGAGEVRVRVATAERCACEWLPPG